MSCIFTIDVEDWFHILDLPSTPNPEEWDGLPSRVEKNFLRLLDVLGEKGRKATCFFLGWVAERYPQLVRETISRGHEVASHGYRHQLVFHMTAQQFRADAVRSREIIEQIAGQRVLGYRAPGFSVTRKTPWFFEELRSAGYRYDSSVFPASRSHGGLPSYGYSGYREASSADLVEFPISVQPILGRPICFFGGGYLRLFPYRVIKSMTESIVKQGRNVIFYVHPREIDPEHPRLPMSPKRHFQSYFNLSSTEKKIRCLLSDFPTTTFRECLEGMPGCFCDSFAQKESVY